MPNVKNIISDEDVNLVHANANFGSIGKRKVISHSLLKCACGYYCGSTSTQILEDHGLVTKEWELTTKGKAYLWAAFSKEKGE